MPVPASALLGCGRRLPARLVTNHDLAGDLATAPAALAERTGVSRRYYAADGEGPSDLARDAARDALAAAGLGPADVDLIVFATMTPDIAFPGAGCYLQHKLGCRTVGALDVRAQCAGFVFGLATADRFVRAGAADRVLVVGGEVHSSALDFSPRAAAVTPVFGDGAGAVLLGPAGTPGILATIIHSDPTGLERFWCEFPASRNYPARMELAHYHAGRHFYVLDAAALHAQAVESLAGAAGEALAQAGVAASDVALAIVHYVDPRVACRAADAAGFAAARVVAPAAAFGHVAGGGIPIALAEAVAAGRVRAGDLVCCAAFGAGMSWGAAVLRL
jgi:3-oxoacyl-[acyl-carrier-protein] synthase-3